MIFALPEGFGLQSFANLLAAIGFGNSLRWSANLQMTKLQNQANRCAAKIGAAEIRHGAGRNRISTPGIAMLSSFAGRGIVPPRFEQGVVAMGDKKQKPARPGTGTTKK